uniref:MYB binding protein (P160) 1a n=1 Tax=Callorhinchus milii TaxID=7868 RepID=A0A4W3JNS2_CALMI|eukprot:gi/632975647/ref/XP_007904343.1/ PREDICTED: myb-binding protein 1A [Callorhinchus milii]
MAAAAGSEEPSGAGSPGTGAKAIDTKSLLKQNREFLDFFWDIAKPEQAVRLRAVEGLLAYLRNPGKDDELKYALNRLIEGLAATREIARPGFSLALAQLLQFYEEIPLQTVLEQIKDKHNVQKVKKKLIRNAAFGNLFGVLALSQSGRLPKEPKVLLQCVQLLQSLAQFKDHLRDLPRQTILDILSETPEAVFKNILFEALQSDLSSAFNTPEQLHLLLVAIQRFPQALKPTKLKALLGSTTIVTRENIPKLTEMLKIAAKSMKKANALPELGADLLRVALKEDAFELFWKDVVETRLLQDHSGLNSYLCFRLLGHALPLLTLPQLQLVLTGPVMQHYGEHVLIAQLPGRFKFASEMERNLDSFFDSVTDPEKQLAVLTGFSCLTNQGYPVISSYWKVIPRLQPSALSRYVDWLKNMFTSPDLDTCLDFSTKRQKLNPEAKDPVQHSVLRLRKWIVARLTSIVEKERKKEEDLVMDIARFIFFHAFCETKQSTPDIPETEASLSVPLDTATRDLVATSFFGLLHCLNCLPRLGDTGVPGSVKEKHIQGMTADGNLWIYCVVRYVNALLFQKKCVQFVQPFTKTERAAWDRMLQAVEDLQTKATKATSLKTSAFQLLFLLVGIHLFKNSEDCLELMGDLHNCLGKALENKKKQTKVATDEEEPDWVEMVIEILLSLLSQQSRLMRHVSKMVFARICPHLTKRGLQLILAVLTEDEDDEESAVVVTDDSEDKKRKQLAGDQNEELIDGDDSSSEEEEEDADADEEEDESEDNDEEEDVDDAFRMELMKVLQGGKTVSGDGEESSDDDLDDEAMMTMDKNIASLFAEHQKHVQAKKDAKEKMRKEQILRRDFKIKVLDLIEVLITKQPENPLIFDIMEPMLAILEGTMRSHNDEQEQTFLRKTAFIFRNQLCKAKRYCHSGWEMREDLHELMERLVTRACKQADSSVAHYHFSGALYIFRVLKGNAIDPMAAAQNSKKEEGGADPQSGQLDGIGSLDLARTTVIFKEALTAFMTRRKCSVTGPMLLDLISRFPVMCSSLLRPTIKYITDGVRQHQQGQASCLVLKSLLTRELRHSMTDSEWEEIIGLAIKQVTQSLKNVSEFKVKVDQEKVIACLELTSFLIKIVKQQKLNATLTELVPVVESLKGLEGFDKSSQLDDTYWNTMKLLGFERPKKEPAVRVKKETPQSAVGTKKKKKGFLPETKKRKNRNKQQAASEENSKETQEKGLEPGAGGAAKPRKKKMKRKKMKSTGGGDAERAAQEPAPKKGRAEGPLQAVRTDRVVGNKPKAKPKRAQNMAT